MKTWFTKVARWLYASYRSLLVAVVFYVFWGVVVILFVPRGDVVSLFSDRFSVPAGLIPLIPIVIGTVVIGCWEFRRAWAVWDYFH